VKPALALLLLAVVPAAAGAQAISCRVPDRLPASPPPGGQARLLPIGGYTLALSWSPEYCRFRQQSSEDRFQCGDPTSRFGFVLHGLWPDGRGDLWPQYCRKGGAVPEPVLRETLCVMPSVELQQHEWAKHGVCAFRTVPPERFTPPSAIPTWTHFPATAICASRALPLRSLREIRGCGPA